MSDLWETHPYKDKPVVKLFLELDKVKNDHRSLVLITNGFMELLIETLIKGKCKNARRITDDRRSYPYSAKLLILNELGVIPDLQYQLYDWFRKIRNDAAHNPFFTVTKSSLKLIKDTELQKPEKLHLLCIHIVGGLWNAHIEIFSPIFAPNMNSKESMG